MKLSPYHLQQLSEACSTFGLRLVGEVGDFGNPSTPYARLEGADLNAEVRSDGSPETPIWKARVGGHGTTATEAINDAIRGLAGRVEADLPGDAPEAPEKTRRDDLDARLKAAHVPTLMVGEMDWVIVPPSPHGEDTHVRAFGTHKGGPVGQVTLDVDGSVAVVGLYTSQDQTVHVPCMFLIPQGLIDDMEAARDGGEPSGNFQVLR